MKQGFPDALFCSNDDEAIGACRALRRRHRVIPDQTAVMGFDDFDDAEHMSPPMTSIRLPLESACQRVFEMLLTRIENVNLPPRYESFPAKLYIRESTQVNH